MTPIEEIVKVIPTHGDFFLISTKDNDYIIMYILQDVLLGDNAVTIQDYRKKRYLYRYIFLNDINKKPYSLQEIRDKLTQLFLKLEYK